MNRLRQVNTTLSDTLATTTGTLEDVNARANRLQQRNVLIAAENQQNERQLEDRLRAAEADRQLAHDQADAAVRDTAEARKWRLDVRLVWLWLMAILLVALLAFALWVCWINQIDFEYIRRRRREFYGMD
jgi:cation transport ATPase